MFFRGRSSKERSPLPPRLARLLRESRWLLLVAAAAFLILILATYDRADP
ncbi:MAG: DNA translocase FtsK 4TM domain-containing protein, partial [Burkholderiales bacterium]|nr:DNA translocase FtsK 4TM domain-containing protein [Burkholderiales bacterium]